MSWLYSRGLVAEFKRAARLRGLGNAQVPQVVVLAWWVLSGIKGQNGGSAPCEIKNKRRTDEYRKF